MSVDSCIVDFRHVVFSYGAPEAQLISGESSFLYKEVVT
jgi:hypothetical protein